MKLSVLMSLFFFVLGLFFIGLQDADAARIGGGRSFGGSPGMSRPAPVAPQYQRSAPSRSAAAPTQATRPGGFFGGLGGGLLGGFLAGSLLGSIFSGGGMGAGGGGGLLDILLLGLLAYFAYRFFARRKVRQPEASSAGDTAAAYRDNSAYNRSEPSDAWGRLQDNPSQPSASWNNVSVPENFDAEDFMRGAKLLYNRMQQSWSNRNLTDIAQFSTEAFMKEIRSQFAEDPTPCPTDVLMLEATLIGVEQGSGVERVQVLFDANLREGSSGMAEQVREVWHFIRQTEGDTSWRLDGIQQTV